MKLIIPSLNKPCSFILQPSMKGNMNFFSPVEGIIYLSEVLICHVLLAQFLFFYYFYCRNRLIPLTVDVVHYAKREFHSLSDFSFRFGVVSFGALQFTTVLHLAGYWDLDLQGKTDFERLWTTIPAVKLNPTNSFQTATRYRSAFSLRLFKKFDDFY